MTLHDVLATVPGNALVTVSDYLDGSIFVDCKQCFDVIGNNDQQWHRYHGKGLKNFEVYGIEVGKVYGDLIVSVLYD